MAQNVSVIANNVSLDGGGDGEVSRRHIRTIPRKLTPKLLHTENDLRIRAAKLILKKKVYISSELPSKRC